MWLWKLYDTRTITGLGGILGDDMGLGAYEPKQRVEEKSFADSFQGRPFRSLLSLRAYLTQNKSQKRS